MEKAALFEIGTTHIRLTLSKIIDNEHFFVYQMYSEPVQINEHIEDDGLIKSAKIKECIALLKMYKKICEAEGIKDIHCIVSAGLSEAKNYSSFLDEAASMVGLDFRKLTPDEEVNAVYASTINTLDIAKGIIVNITSHSTRIINYNRRVILDSVTIPLGSVSLFQEVSKQFADRIPSQEEVIKAAIEHFQSILANKAHFLTQVDPEASLIGVSDVFVSMGRISRKMRKYPLDIDHNYTTDADDFRSVFDFVKTLDIEKKQKLKGISAQSASTIVCGMCIIEAILNHSKLGNITVGCAYRNLGLMLNFVLPANTERPVSDVLGYSLETIAVAAGLDKKAAEQQFSLALTLFKQLKVLHKLPRVYAKILRIASYLYHIGKMANPVNFEKLNYHAILTSNITGASHKELVLAAFAAVGKKWEDFNLAEWVRYKDLVTQEDFEAVRKLMVIIAMSDAMNMRNCGVVKDITCDILGDSVILKLIADETAKASRTDVKALQMEIFYALKYSTDFQKAFKKKLEIL